MSTLRTVLAAALIVTVAGCTTVKGWVSKLGASDTVHQPTPLASITPSIRVQHLWSRSVGGERMLGLRDRPAIDNGRVYVEDAYGPDLYALDLASGREIWRTKTKLRLTGGPAAGAGVVVAGSVNGDVVAFSADTGVERWRAKLNSEIISSPVIAGDMAIVRSGNGHVSAFDLADGKTRWAFDHDMPILTLRGNSSPVLGANGLVYLGYENGTLVALRAADGVKVWEQNVAQSEGRTDIDRLADIDGEILAGPDGVFAASYKGKVGVFSPDSGTPGWTHSVVSYGGIARAGNTLFISDASGTVWGLDSNSGSAVWKQEALGWRWLTTPAVQDGYVVVGDLDGYLHWLKPDSGAIVARERIGGRHDAIRATPQVSADGILVAVTTKGRLAAYRINK
ncbi:MAG TPA: outer membrane protein assembly factor BamB [Xanthomonadaceae bacterium]